MRYSLLLMILLSFFLAACGGRATPTATAFVVNLRTQVATPTPLPELATAVPVGFPQNPLRLMLVPLDRSAAEALETQLEDAILQATSVSVDIVLANDPAELLQALCDTTTDQLTAVWMNGLGYAAARGENCGDATLQLQRGDATGEAVQIVVSTELGLSSLASLENQTFCRTSATDFTSWVLPSLLLRQNELDLTSLREVRDIPNQDAIIRGVANGDCGGAALSESAYSALPENTKNRLTVAATSIKFPYGVLMYPFQIPLAARLSLNEGLPKLIGAALLPTTTPAPDVTQTATIEPSIAPDVTQETTAEATTAPDVTQEATAETTTAPDVTQEATAEATTAPDVTQEATIEPTTVVTPTPQSLSLLAPFFGDGVFVRLEPEDLAELDAFLAETGINFGVLGD